MTISIRLDEQTLNALKIRAKQTGSTVSALVREAVREKLELQPSVTHRKSSYDLWQSMFSGHRSGESDRSQRVKELVGEQVEAKHRDTRRSR